MEGLKHIRSSFTINSALDLLLGLSSKLPKQVIARIEALDAFSFAQANSEDVSQEEPSTDAVERK